MHKNVKFFVKLKPLPHILLGLGVWLGVGFSPESSHAQVPGPPARRPANVSLPPPDSTRPRVDTVVSVSDSIRKKGDFETTVNYTARDSSVLDVVTRTEYLYGEAQVDYGSISLKADYIELNLQTNVVYARGTPDSTGKLQGGPVFQDGTETYNADEMRYNFKTKKAIIKGVVTKQGDGNVRGTQVKKDPEDNLYIRDAIYTTCDLKHPHFYINAQKIKLVKDKQVVTGPFNLVIADIPTPLGFAFGLFPLTKQKPNGTSGIIVPTYGEEPRQRGFFLRDGGYYWALNQYIGIRFTGEIYSRGSWGLATQSTYKKRYLFDGSFAVRYNKRKVENTDATFGFNQDFWIDWSHRPVTRGQSSFSASVSAGTSKFNARNSFDYNSYLSNAFRSAVSYSTSFRGTPFRTAINLNHDQNTTTGVVNLILPSVTLNMNRIYPFKPKLSTGQGWWETVNVGFDFTGGAQFSNGPRGAGSFPFRVANAPIRDTVIAFNPFNSDNLSELLRRAQVGGSYTVPVSASLKLLRYFSLNPNVNYQGYTYQQQLNYAYNPADSSVRVDTLRQLSHAYNFSAGASLTTRVYGTLNFKGDRRVQSIRHTLIPSVSLSYAPDFSDPKYGFYQQVRINNRPNPTFPRPNSPGEPGDHRLVSRYNGFRNGGPGIGESGSIGFSLNNTLEAKVRTKNDSTGKKTEKVSLLNSLNLSGGYNLLADSLKLSNLSLSANTRFLKTFDINFSSTIDPYVYIRDPFVTRNILTPGTPENNGIPLNPGTLRNTRLPDVTDPGVRINRYTWQAGGGLGNISSANIGINTSFQPGGARKNEEARKKRVEDSDALPEEKAQIVLNPNAYVDFNIPWTLNVSYSFNYSRQGLSQARVSQTLSFSGDVKLTEKWKVGFNSGYDFVQKGISYTQLNIYRDLHCWEMSFNWTPFGARQSYSFMLNVRSSILKDLKLQRQRSFYDRNLGY